MSPGRVGEALPPRGVAAHRGASRSQPENTVAALRAAAALGAHQVEFDVRRAADGAIVLMHDESVDRTTDGSGLVAELPLAELRRLDAGRHRGPEFAGERVPTLDEALEALPRDLWINVQIKRGEPVAGDVAAALARHDRLHQAFVACGNAAAREARRVHPEVLVCNLVRQETRARYLDHALATGADFVQLHYLRGAPEPELVTRAHAAGLRVNHCCAPDEPDLDALFATGVDFLLVDDVEAGLAAARRAGLAPRAR